MKRLLVLLLILFSVYGFATHNRAGEILYKRIAPFTQVVGNITVQVYTYSITLIKYTDHGNGVADRCVDTIYFGDGARGVAPRINGGTGLCNDCNQCGSLIISDPGYNVKINIYTIIHTYSGSGSYLIHSYDPNRNGGVINIPNSINQPFYLESLLIINNFTGANTSPEFTYPPIDRACADKCFYHNPGAYDPDGDSLSYEISTSRGENGQTVPGYSFPDAGPGGTYGINPITGLLTWCVPKTQGEYNLAFIVKEWRKNTSGIYVVIGTVLRDMQVVVGACPTNNPPFVIAPQDTCIEAGTILSKNIIYGDPDYPPTAGAFINVVTLQGNGGAFSAPPPVATISNTVFTITSAATTSTAANLLWQTNCNHIRLQPYQTVFKVEDNGQPAGLSTAIKLVNFATYNIRVVPPSVKNVTATPQGSSINVTWSLSACNPTNNPITSYKIYRKNDCTPFVYNPCQTGVSPTSGFSYVGQTSPTVSAFTDSNGGNGLVVGQDYSYLVIAVYKEGSQSYGSSLVCAKLKRDIPVLLNVDILSTSVTSGSVFVRWEKPLTNVASLDTIALPGPYQFNLKYRPGSTGTYTTVYNSTSPYFLNLATQFTHTNVNTDATDEEYEVEFVANTTTVGTSQRATSIYLNTTPGDRHIDLSWTSSTPWNNYKYTVFRKDPSATTFTPIATTTLTTYTDTSKIVNSNATRSYIYCYKVMGEGKYSDPSITKPLFNTSQEKCATAKDLTPPCSPTLSINADCPTGMVQISWTDVKPLCSDDVTNYILFYKPTVDDQYTQVAAVSWSTTVYNYDGLELISGCYAVQSVDSSNNLSPLSPDFCIDNCPIFELPNIITLNGDGVNDFFKAIRVRQIKEIDLVIFDRWGNLVYKTKDPYFKWDGTSIISKQLVSEGTFFYICDVYEPRLKGIVKRNLKGYMQVAR